jgi:hypothetical protein
MPLGVAMSYSLRAAVAGQLARLAIIAGGLIFASITTAAAVEIPADVQRLLDNPKLCWGEEPYVRTSWGKSSWGPAYFSYSGSDLRRLLESSSFARDIEAIYIERVEGETFIYVKKPRPKSSDSVTVEGERWHLFPCSERATLPTSQWPPKTVVVPGTAGSSAPHVAAPPPPTEYRPQDQVMMRWTGPNVGVQLSGILPTMTWTEMLAATEEITDRNNVLGNPGADVGVTAGFAAAVNTPIGGVIVDPFVSADYIGHAVEQPLGGSAFLATRSNYQVTAGVKFGPLVGANSWVYGIGGLSFLNETMTVTSFVPVSSEKTTTVPGLTLGVGGAAQVPALSDFFGHPVAVSAEYRHTFWQTAHFNEPPAWQLSDYAFRRDDDALMLGLTVFLNPGAMPRF